MLLFYVLIFYFIFVLLVFNIKTLKMGSIENLSNKTARNIYLILTMGLLMILTIFRRIDVGNDTFSYYILFMNIKNYGVNINPEIELGYKYLNFLIGSFTNNYQILLVVIGVMSYVSVIRFINAYSYNLSFSVLLFFLLFYKPYINVMRQVIAISLVLVAIKFLFKEKPIRYFILIILGVFVHNSVVICILFPFFYKIKFTKKKAFLFILFSILLSISGDFIIQLFLSIGKSTKYVLKENAISSLFNFLMNAVLFIVQQILFFRIPIDTPINDKRKMNFYSWMALMSIFFSIIGFRIWIMQRLILYFNIFYLLSIPNSIVLVKRSKLLSNTFRFAIVVMLILYQTGIYILRPDWTTEFPYHFFFQ